jgi:hypothetical protein
VQNPTKTTELEAVNVCLSLLGESPVSSLTAPYGVDVANARKLIYEKSKDVQLTGWAFNKETDVTLTREAVTTFILLAPNAIQVDADTDGSVDVVERDGKLYDRKNRRYTFDHDLKVEITYFFAFDTLPEVARRYIMILAARSFQKRYVGSEIQEMFTREEEIAAKVRFENAEGNTADINILNSPDQFYIARRGQFRRGR